MITDMNNSAEMKNDELNNVGINNVELNLIWLFLIDMCFHTIKNDISDETDLVNFYLGNLNLLVSSRC